MKREQSDRNTCQIEIEPRRLLCVNCLRGGGQTAHWDPEGASPLRNRLESNPDLHVTLVGSFDEVGARTPRFETQSPDERRRDLAVLQRLGLCYGDTRTARDLFARIAQRIPDLEGICRRADGPGASWPECPMARSACYAEGNHPYPRVQQPWEMARNKEASCQALAASDGVTVRAHHPMCVCCFAGRDDNETPLAEDNLYEVWVKARENPEILFTLIEGPGDCVVCPPCHSFKTSRGICVAACHLRDRKKDLDFLSALDLNPGDSLTARELFARMKEKIPHAAAVCAYESDNSPEWASCGGARSGRYETGLDRILQSLL